MVILMAAFDQTAKSSLLDKHKLEIVWRLQYAFAAAALLTLAIYRYYKLKESGL